MYFAPPSDYDDIMKKIPYSKLTTVGRIREYFARQSGADFTEPITAGIFVSIAAWASEQRSENITPLLEDVKSKRRVEPKISGRHTGAERKAGSRRTYGCPARKNQHSILREGLSKRTFRFLTMTGNGESAQRTSSLHHAFSSQGPQDKPRPLFDYFPSTCFAASTRNIKLLDPPPRTYSVCCHRKGQSSSSGKSGRISAVPLITPPGV